MKRNKYKWLVCYRFRTNAVADVVAEGSFTYDSDKKYLEEQDMNRIYLHIEDYIHSLKYALTNIVKLF